MMTASVNGLEPSRSRCIYLSFFVELHDYPPVLKTLDMTVGGLLFLYVVRSEKPLRFEGESPYMLWNDG